jgi:hypothetical protein
LPFAANGILQLPNGMCENGFITVDYEEEEPEKDYQVVGTVPLLQI